MFSALVIDLLQRNQALEDACNEFAKTVRHDKELPLLLPTYSGRAGGEREAAIASMTQLWHLDLGETLIEAGIVCSSVETITSALRLNDAKDQFQCAIKALRDSGPKGEKSRLDKLIDGVLRKEGKRTEEITLALKRARISQLDLLRCYAKIRVLPKNLESLSWTWAKTHSSIVPVSMDEAVKMAQSLPNEETKETILSLLEGCPQGTSFACKKKLPNQLRANLVWHEDGERRRKAVTISGIVLSQDNTLPRYVWRDNPDLLAPEVRQERLSRLDTCIEPKPFIKVLRLHRYIEGHNGSK